ncbi:putative 2-succinyl-6-hydroxy-2,4-cyclohexadiene-1-carboxylate synthase [Dictyobacter alpinus]|uniref:Putative 2-succinyl-6-hydroxy-2,4-cyclohexadiene-1-carboxylate synthase n=1 Tax=Dictyobacter alpinus TaxID=2014873 RepID=A0A402B6L7_9CHLR|nr:alpha/beta hydrolase [Dictyobacter alpinus]GCE26970.1 putative 2-succinyl-6-hydroxy-2,4-cyclohexadiene-1-carboxylate synthase [Dictyobacter alpinus]
MSQWSDGEILAHGVNLHYYRTGGAHPPVLLLHGFTDSGLCWTPVAQALASDYDVIMFDARGHGRSGAAANGFTTELLVADALAVIQELKLEQVALLGHSMGAHTAAHVTKKHPELVRALLLEDPPWRGTQLPELTQDDINGLKQWESHLRIVQQQSLAERIEDASEYNPRWSQAEIQPWAEAQGQFRLEVFSQGLARVTQEWQVLMPQLSNPTLLITGDPDRGAIVTSEIAQQALATWDNGTLAHIDGAGHSIRRDQYEPFITAVRQFLKEK